VLNRSYQHAWRRRSRGAAQVLRGKALRGGRGRKNKNSAQLELDFCAEPWRPLAIVARAAAIAERPLTEEELAAEFERLFP